MNIFDIINSIFKFWFWFEFCCFKAVVNTKLIKILAKVCSNFSNNEFWRKLDLYFIDHFSSFWESWRFWVESNQFFFNMFWLLLLLFYEINQLLFCLFKKLIRLIKLGLEFSPKAFLEDKVSEVRVNVLSSICSDDNLFWSIDYSTLNSINNTSVCSKLWL